MEEEHNNDTTALRALREDNHKLRQRVLHLEETSESFRRRITALMCTEGSAKRDFFAAVESPPGDRSGSATALKIHDWIEKYYDVAEQLRTAQESIKYWRARSVDVSSSASPPRGMKSPKSPRAVPNSDGGAVAEERRKRAALTRRLGQTEEQHHIELSSRDETIATLSSQLNDLQTVLAAVERERNDVMAQFLDVKAQRVPYEATIHSLEGRLAALESERKLFIRTAEDLQHRTLSRSAEEKASEASKRQELEQELASSYDKLLKAEEASKAWERQAGALTSEAELLRDSLAMTQRQNEELRKMLADRTHSEARDTKDSVSAILLRLGDVVASAERSASMSAQGGVAQLAKRVSIAETLSKSVDQYASMLSVKEKQLAALLAEIESCERVGWPLRTSEARQCLLDVTMEHHHQPPPPREIVVRTDGDWKEVRDTRRNSLYYVTSRVEHTPFGNSHKPNSGAHK